MKNQMIFNQTWRTLAVAPSFVVRAYGFDLREVCSLPSHRNAGMTTKHHAAAMKATVKGPKPWSPPVT